MAGALQSFDCRERQVVGLGGVVVDGFDGHAAATPPGKDEIGTILPGGHTFSDTRRLIMYARREPGNRLLSGGLGYQKLWDRVGGNRWRFQDVARIFPTVRRDSWRFKWSGKIALTTDRVPHFHEPAPGILAGLGDNGRGVAMSLVLGRILAERVLGAGPGQLPFPVTPIQHMASREIQTIGAGVAMRFLRFRDSSEFD